MSNFDNKEIKIARLSNLEGTSVSRSTYNLLMGLTILWGIGINLAMAMFAADAILSIKPLFIIIAYFIGSIICMSVVYASKNPLVSFLAFSGLAASMGLILTYIVGYYAASDIATAFILTGLVVALMVVVSSIFPQAFLKLGPALGITLLITIVVEIVSILLGMHGTWIDYIVVIIFCGYTGYDWAKSQAYPATIDNAVDSAADIYVDIVNLFVRILSIISKK